MSALPDVGPLLQRMAGELTDYLAQRQIQDPAFVGIHTGGVWVAEQLRSLCLPDAPLGTLDIAFYRDDFAGSCRYAPTCSAAAWYCLRASGSN